jgi:hypothetical protein
MPPKRFRSIIYTVEKVFICQWGLNYMNKSVALISRKHYIHPFIDEVMASRDFEVSFGIN